MEKVFEWDIVFFHEILQQSNVIEVIYYSILITLVLFNKGSFEDYKEHTNNYIS